jgi:hypothetical protein
MPCRATRAQEQHRIGSLSLSGSAMRWSCGRRARRSTRSPRHLATRSGAAHPKPSAARWRRRFSTWPTELRALEVERLDALWAVPPRTVAGAAILLALPRAPASAGRSRRLPHRARGRYRPTVSATRRKQAARWHPSISARSGRCRRSLSREYRRHRPVLCCCSRRATPGPGVSEAGAGRMRLGSRARWWCPL